MMKISDLIEELEDCKKNHGDLKVYIFDRHYRLESPFEKKCIQILEGDNSENYMALYP